MRVQLRLENGSITNLEMTGLQICENLADTNTEKISFDLGECRLALYPSGHFQIFGGVVNFPRLESGK